jgi:predicted permease
MSSHVSVVHLSNLPVTVLFAIGVVLAMLSFRRHKAASSLVIGSGLSHFAAESASAVFRNVAQNHFQIDGSLLHVCFIGSWILGILSVGLLMAAVFVDRKNVQNMANGQVGSGDPTDR